MTDVSDIDLSTIQDTKGLSSYEANPAAGVDPEYLQAVENEQAAQAQYESPTGIAKATAIGALKGADFTGIGTQLLTSDKVGQALGLNGPMMSDDEIKQYAVRNPLATGLGEVGGFGAAALTGAGEAVTGLSAIKAAGALTERQFAKLLMASGGKEAASVLAKSIPKYAGSLVEGSALGLGQLVQENALGDADLNAQNVLVNASLGGLLGVGAHALFSGVQAAAPYVNEAGKVISEKATTFADPSRAAAEIVGIPSSEQAFLAKSRPEVWNNIPQLVVDSGDKGIFTANKTYAENFASAKQNAAVKINNTIDSIDNALAGNDSLKPTYSDIGSGMLNIINSYIEKQPADFNLGKIKEFGDSLLGAFLERPNLASPMNASDIQELRQWVDSQIKYGKAANDQSPFGTVAKDVRNFLSDQVQDLAAKASSLPSSPENTNLLSQLMKANLDYGTATRVLDSMTKQISKAEPLMDSYKDWKTAGLIFGAITHPVGAGIAAVTKLAQTNAWRKVALYAQIERSGNSVNSAIEKSADGFFKNAQNPVSPTSLNAIGNSIFSKESFQGNKTKDPNHAFNNIGDNLDYMSDAQNFINTMQNRMSLMQKYAPNTSAASVAIAGNAISFLKSKIPRDPKVASPFSTSQWTPSSVQKAQFERYLNAVENPMSVIKAMKNGEVTPEAVEALKVVYPKVFAQVQNSFLEKAQENRGELTYNQRVRLGTLLGISTDSSLNQENLLGLQSVFAPFNQKPVGPSPAAAKPVKGMASNKLQHIGSQLQTPFQMSQGRK